MYKNMLDGTNHNNYHGTITSSIIPESTSVNTHTHVHGRSSDYIHDKNKKNKIPRNENNGVPSLDLENEKHVNQKESMCVSAPTVSHDVDMDTIFIKITDLYTDEVFLVIYNTLIELERDNTNYLDYANGLNTILHPINVRIKKWIDENIVF
jgi:hypothetical protein